MCWKPANLNLNLQGQIGLETFKVLVLIFFKFHHLEFYLSNSNCLFIIKWLILKIDDLDLDLQGQHEIPA